MADIEWLSFTDEEKDRVTRKALQAAWRAVSTLRDQEDPDANAALKAILTAFQVVNQVQSDANRTLERANPDKHCHGVHLDTHHIVATALANLGNFYHDDPLYSTAGYFFVAFAHACKAMDAYNEAMSALAGDGALWGDWSAKDVLGLLDALDQPAREQPNAPGSIPPVPGASC